MMEELSDTKQALMEELASLRQRIRELEQSQAAKKIAELHNDAALEELQASEQKYRQLAENAYDQIMCMDLDGIIWYANSAACDLAGPINLIGLPMRSVISPDQLKRHEDLLQRRREGDLTDYSFEWELIPPGSDRSLIMDVRSSALVENGKPTGVLLIARDMTDRKLREEELRTTKEKYQALVEGISDVIFEIDGKGVFLYLSPIVKKIWGCDPEEVIGKNYIDFVHPDDQELVRNRFRDFGVWEEPPIAFRVKTKSDEIRWARARMKPRFENGKFVQANGILIDITDQIRAEKALRDSELLFKNIFSMSPAMMVIHRLSDGRFLEINEVFNHVTGYQREEIIGHTIDEFDVIEPANLEQLYEILSRQNEIHNEEIQFKTKTGEMRYGLFSATLIGENEERKVLGVLFDITERKQAEALLKVREEESQRFAKDLEEANIALRVVLSRQQDDQKILEEKIQFNVNEIILPFISSLMSGDLKKRDKHYLDLLESNLKSIMSPFMRTMSHTCKSLTPKETLIAEMIRQGKNSKDIADMLSLSVGTINCHRNNIRKKLNIKKQKTNLKSHLLSL